MQLYTEEQVLKIIFTTKQWNNLSSDYLISTVTPIELPSDEEIEEEMPKRYFGLEKEGFLEGAKWMREKILNQRK